MTANAKPPVASSTPGNTGAGFLAGLLIWAFAVWLAGIGLHRGYNVSVPFLPTYLLAVAGSFVLNGLTRVVAVAWRDIEIEQAPNLAAAQTTGTMAAQRLMGQPSIADIMAQLGADLPGKE